jgi:hypothetical protein
MSLRPTPDLQHWRLREKIQEQIFLNKKVTITCGEAAREAFEVPEIEWFLRLHKRAGTEPLLHVLIKFAGVKEALLCGFRAALRASKARKET